MKKISQKEQEKNELKKKDKKTKLIEFLYINFSPRRMFSYFMIILIIYTFIQIKKFLIKDKERNDPNINKNIIEDTEETEEERFKNKVRLAIYYPPIQNEEINRITSILVNSMSKQSIFDLYLLLNSDFKNEDKINSTVHKLYINIHSSQVIRRKLLEYQIEMFIYQYYLPSDIKMLKKLEELKGTKTIIINHFNFLYWLYNGDYEFFSELYDIYKESKYIVSFIPFENYILYKQWNFDTIFMNNIMPYDYNKITPSDLSSKTIIMIGQASDKMKRFDLGIKAMKYIIKEIPDCEMKIISDLEGTEELKNLIKELNLEKNIKFEVNISSPEIYYEKASIHLFPSLTESSGLSLCETKIYGIPNILVGLDYLACAKDGGVVNIYDDNPKTIAKEAIKILKNETYRINLGKEARESMKKFDNDLIIDKWLRFILCAYLDDNYYNRVKQEGNKTINLNEEKEIFNNQIKLLQKRIDGFKNIKENDIMDFNYMKKILNKIKKLKE